MKKIFSICLMFVFYSCHFLIFSQEVNTRKYNSDQSLFISPKNHDPNFSGFKKGSTKSFYQSKSEWQHIIDTTWGPGDPLARKLEIFNIYAKAVHDNFAGFTSWPLNWDSLYNHYLNQINESTSKGSFSAIMSHFAYELRDLHTYAADSAVIFTPRNPGIPLMFTGTYGTVEHFGAVTTVLSDSSTLVLRVSPNHPLGIEPGDIILGYEGIPWKNLVKELFDAGLPGFILSAGCNTANTYYSLSGAGGNWHLFDTIDILKYSTGDAVHLSVLPLLNLDIPPMVNNEQLPVKNIPLLSFLPSPLILASLVFSDTLVTYGIVENSNIGYIYIFAEVIEAKANLQLYNAVNALKNTDALIIDLRMNYGGWAMFEKAFNILFNEFNKTTCNLFRCNTNTFEMCSAGDWSQFQISGSGPDYYDRPIAVLIGPSCMSTGDLTAHRLRYHPMVRFFGASPPASFGHGSCEINGWSLNYCGADEFHINDPGNYLNRKEFPVDYHVWFNKDDVAKGKDPIVEKSLEWINNLAYGHSVTTDKWLYSAGDDTVIINSNIENPNSHELSAKLIFESLNGSFIDSADMASLNLSDLTQWQGKWKTPGPTDNTYFISLKVTDINTGTYFTNKHATRITNIPLLIDSLSLVRLNDTTITFKPFLKNAGTHQTISKIKVNFAENDPWVIKTSPAQIGCSDLLSGLVKGTTAPFKVTYDPATAPDPLYFNLSFTVSSDGWPYWVIDTTVTIATTGIEPEKSIPFAFSLGQNYPNPFNTVTTINWQIPMGTIASLKIFDICGREVATLFEGYKPGGKYESRFNAESLPGGVYFYQLRVGEFTEVRKMLLIK